MSTNTTTGTSRPATSPAASGRGWRRVLAVGVLPVALAVTATACSSGRDEPVEAGAPSGQAPTTSGQAATVPSGRILDARLVTGGLGWLTTSGGLFVTEDAGGAWRKWNLPTRADTVLGVALLGPRQALIAANTGTGVGVSASNDGGASWQAAQLGSATVEPTDAEFAYQGQRVVGLLVQQPSSSNFSLADWYATKDGGRTWSRHEAPAAGKVSVTGDGTVWLAGGPARNQLFKSADGGASWAPVTLPKKLASGAFAVDPPTTGPEGVTLLAVTVPGAEKSSVVVLTSRDKGRSWTESARAELDVSVGGGVTLPTSPGPGDSLMVAAPDGSAVVRVPLAGGPARRLPPRGLVGGIVGMTLTDDRLGWATYAVSSCKDDKTTCTSQTGLLVTRNGGETWQQARAG
jgi:hypothetical protein